MHFFSTGKDKRTSYISVSEPLTLQKVSQISYDEHLWSKVHKF